MPTTPRKCTKPTAGWKKSGQTKLCPALVIAHTSYLHVATYYRLYCCCIRVDAWALADEPHADCCTDGDEQTNADANLPSHDMCTFIRVYQVHVRQQLLPQGAGITLWSGIGVQMHWRTQTFTLPLLKHWCMGSVLPYAVVHVEHTSVRVLTTAQSSTTYNIG